MNIYGQASLAIRLAQLARPASRGQSPTVNDLPLT